MFRATKAILVVSLLSIVFVSGCGGSQTSVVPFSEAGFAQSGKQFEHGASFNLVGRQIVDENGIRSFKDQVIFVEFLGADPMTPSKSLVALTINGNRSLLESSASDRYFSADGQNFAFLQQYTTTANTATLAFIDYSDATTYSGGYEVVGFDTNPSAINNRAGTARYNGTAEFVFRGKVHGDRNLAFVFGNFSLDANFSNATVDGSFALTNINAHGISIPQSTWELNAVAINENGFTGTFAETSSTLANSNGRLVNPLYDGRFFGANGEAVGGSITATLEFDSLSPLFMEGAFLAE